MKKEILNNLLNLRFSLAYFLCTFLLVGSAAIMLSEYLTEKKVYDVNVNFYRRDLDRLQYPGAYARTPKTVMRPPMFTKVLAIGGEKDPDVQADVMTEYSPYFHGDFKRNPLTNLFPSVDMVFIVGVIISLLIFLLTYDAISGEREEGTLKVLLSCPVPRDKVMIAKWLGGFVSLVFPFVTAWLVVMLIFFFSRGIGVTFDEWLRILALFGVCLLYVAVVFSLSMMVSVLVRASTTAALVLLLVWAVGILVIPSAATPAAYLIVGPTSVQETEANMQRIGILSSRDSNKQRDEFLSKKFGRRAQKDLTASERAEYNDIRSKWQWIFQEQKVEGIVGEGQKLTRLEARIDDLSRWFARVSPYGCLQNMCTTLAGTGFQHERDLRECNEDFARRTLAFMRDAFTQPGGFDVNGSPQYTYRQPRAMSAITGCLVDATVLALMGIFFFLVAYVRFVRMDLL